MALEVTRHYNRVTTQVIKMRHCNRINTQRNTHRLRPRKHWWYHTSKHSKPTDVWSWGYNPRGWVGGEW